ncbi:MAG TPA: DUF202 domain-containing protein [Microlunatus sp.]|nr:DUF202 domain-containing protein [Microlunatus sp.]
MPTDPGLQNERTTLAWQRTTLAGLACALLIARLTFSHAAVVAIIIAAVAMVVASALGLLARRRYKINRATWHTDRLGTDGGTVVALTLLILIIAVGATGYVLLG